jgi:hypothetical protein
MATAAMSLSPRVNTYEVLRNETRLAYRSVSSVRTWNERNPP